MKITRAKPTDLSEIVKVADGCGYLSKNVDNKRLLSAVFSDKKQRVFVVKLSSRIVGYITLRKEGRIAELDYLGVLTKYQNKGIGKALFKYAVSLAKREKFKKIVLEVRNDNLKAIAIYLKYGFKAVGVKPKKKLLKIVMEKEF
jgi:ribosomal protein S18 acetylase RimI-like enzyme